MDFPTRLEFRDVSVTLRAQDHDVTVVRGLTLEVAQGEIVALVGESGSGKSMACLAAMGLIDSSAFPRVSGKILLDGEDVLQLNDVDRRALSGERMAMIFQDPMTALNPYMNVGSQVAEVFSVHREMTRRKASQEAVSWLKKVGLDDAPRVARCFPHELSGGMRQRVIIAMALACRPGVLLADEPTTALDSNHTVSILRLVRELTAELSTAVLMVTHDLTLARHVADRVVVFYAGEVVEEGHAWEVLASPEHPYTRGLIGSAITLDGEANASPVTLMTGRPPEFSNLPRGCAFHPRCPMVVESCSDGSQELLAMKVTDRRVRCSEVSL